MTVDPRFAPTPEWTAPRGPSGWPDHPNGTTVLVLGILSITVLVTGPFAWYLGAKTKKEIAASGQHYANERDLEVGRMIGMIMTIVGGSFVVLMVGFWVVFAIFFASVLGSFPR